MVARVETRMDRASELLVGISEQVKLTNGRVSVLELANAAREGAIKERERIYDEMRKRKSMQIAEFALWKPATVGALIGGCSAALVEVLKTML